MSSKKIQISSRATGNLQKCLVYVYDTKEEMYAAGRRWNGFEPNEDCQGMCQATRRCFQDADGNLGKIVEGYPVIRLWKGRLSLKYIVHEVNHAAVFIYGLHTREDTKLGEILHQGNETLAYLQSDLTVALADKLKKLGYVDVF